MRKKKLLSVKGMKETTVEFEEKGSVKLNKKMYEIKDEP